jgi:signal transduction histidine kinase
MGSTDAQDGRPGRGLFGVVDRLIPPILLATSETRARARVLVISSVGIGLLTSISHTIRGLTVSRDTSFWLGATLIAFFFALPVVQRVSASPRLAGGLLAVALALGLPVVHSQVGHFPAPVIAFFACVPLLATFFLGSRAGLAGALAMSAAVIALGTQPAPTPEAFAAFRPTLIATFVLAPLIVYLLAVVYEAIRVRNELDLKHLNAELATARAAAEQADRRKTDYLLHMSHELRTPLNAMIGFSELIAEELRGGDLSGSDAVSLAADATKIGDAGNYLLGLINGLLDIAKIEAGTVDLTIEEIDVASLLEGLRDTIAPLAAAQGNRLSVAAAAALPAIRSDRQRILQIMLNLVGNACKFTTDGTITVGASLTGDAQRVRIEVADTGVGMTPEQLTTIFEPFVQVDESASRRRQGSGLGLAITRELIKVLGGSVVATSVVGQGSTFTLEVPLAAPLPRAVTSSSSPEARALRQRSSTTK